MIKMPGEIQRLGESAALNEQAINAMLRAAKPGVKESELAGIYKSEVARAGGQVYWMHMNISRGGNSPVIKDHVLQKGDIFRVDMGCSLNGYHADVCKSGCVGAEPTDEHRKRYNAIQAGVLKSVEALKEPAGMLIAVAIANAVLWSGVILFMLLRLVRNQAQIEDQLAKLEGEDKPEDRKS